MKIVIALLVAVVLVAGIGYVVFSNKSVTPTPSTGTQTTTPLVASSNPTGSAMPSTEEAVAVTVDASEYKFTPDTITVKPGQKVKLTIRNVGNMQHNWVVEGQNISTPITESGVASVTEFTAPSKAGEYPTFCAVGSHRAQGMVGKLIVK